MTGDSYNAFIGDNLGKLVQAGRIGRVVVNAAPATFQALSGLPPATTIFVGRDAELAQLREAWQHPGPSVIASGLAGIGKTELVLHAAHAAFDGGEFPGGVLFVDLHGYDESRCLTAGQALEHCLRALGVADVPREEQNRSALFRSLLAHRDRMLIVLDNAASSGQVKPLLPGADTHRVAITSRHRLSGLRDAHHLELGTLDRSAATELVEDPTLAELCGNLPLALRIMAALRDEDPAVDWVSELGEASLDVLDDGDSQPVRAAFALSYRALPPDEQRLFRLLAMHPGDDIEVESTAALADVSPTRARRLLRQLRRAHLLEDVEPGWFTFHDLVRDYSRERVLADEPAESRGPAIRRLFEYYATAAEAAATHLNSGSPRKERSARFTDAAGAMAWMARRRRILVVTTLTATEFREHRTTLRLAWALYPFFSRGDYSEDFLATSQFGALAAARAGDPYVECEFRTHIGTAMQHLGRLDDAMRILESARRTSVVLGTRLVQAKACDAIASVLADLGRYDAAIGQATRALRINRKLKDREGIAHSLHVQGVLYSNLGRWEDALAAKRKALTLYQALSDRQRAGIVQVDIADDYTCMGNLDQAAESALTAIETVRGAAAPNAEGMAYQALGVAYHELGRALEAREAFLTAVRKFSECGAAEQAQTIREYLGEMEASPAAKDHAGEV